MKKVIIDGVDVSGCVRLAIDNISCDLGGECKGWDNCYYKQLQKLKHQYADVLKLAKENADSNEFCLQELEAENERLKLSERDLSRICQGFKKDIETEKSSKLKYYKTLQEIKDIAKEISREKVHNPDIDTIIDKINEVIGTE